MIQTFHDIDVIMIIVPGLHEKSSVAPLVRQLGVFSTLGTRLSVEKLESLVKPGFHANVIHHRSALHHRR